MKRNNKKGFTIVELVIVIAVIAILSAVLIPTFGSVINDANDVAGKQEARNGYLAKYSEDIKDGVVNGLNGTTNLVETGVYEVANNVATYTYTKDGKTYTFDGTNYGGTGLAD